MELEPRVASAAGANAGEDDGDSSFALSQALPVAPGIPDFETEPTTAEEYLARVRWEAQQCPQVVRVEYHGLDEGDTWVHSDRGRLQNQEPDIIPAPPELCPKKRWVQEFASSFSDLREELQDCHEDAGAPMLGLAAAPPLGDISAWESFVGTGDEGDSEELFWCGDCKGGGRAPNTSCILALDQVTTAGLLERLVERFVASGSLPSHHLTSWIFSLAARVEKPLTADIEASLRALLRHASALRMSEPIGGSASHPALPRLNLLVAMAGGYFGQDETLCTLIDV